MRIYSGRVHDREMPTAGLFRLAKGAKGSSLVLARGNGAVFLLKSANALQNEIVRLPIDCSAFISCDIEEFLMDLRTDPQTDVFDFLFHCYDILIARSCVYCELIRSYFVLILCCFACKCTRYIL